MLKDILIRCALEPGISVATAAEKAWLRTKVNEGARDLYQSSDLSGSLREQVFDINPTGNQISLPWQVGEIRAARYYDSGRKIPLHDMRPRYHTDGWAESVYDIIWRVKTISAIASQLVSATRLTVSIPKAESSDFRVAIVGATTNSNRVEEQLLFVAGETSKETTNVFSPVRPDCIDFIGKSGPTTYDVTIADANNNVLAVIPNNLESTRYTVIQVHPRRLSEAQTESCQCIEVLYKHTFFPFVNDYDEFVCAGYDEAIYWNFVLNWNASQPGMEQRVILASAKIQDVLSKRAKESTMGKEKMIDLGPNLMRRMFHAGMDDCLRRGVIYRAY
jgi:hypothetical protein